MGSRIKIILLIWLTLTQLGYAPSQLSHGGVDSIRLGYGASNLFDVSQGIPIYSAGDELWIVSKREGETMVSLMPPGSSRPVRTKMLETDTPTRLYRFSEEDKEGYWLLNLSTNESKNLTLRLLLINPEPTSINLSLESYRLQENQLRLHFRAETTDHYDIEQCLVNDIMARSAVIPLPQFLGNGELRIEKNDSIAIINVDAKDVNPFTFWFELTHPYSFTITEEGGLLTRDLDSATSNRVRITSEVRSMKTAIIEEVPLRKGRFTLRAFFNSARGLSIFETRVLIPDERFWIWLGDCKASSPPLSIFTNLEEPIQKWPNTFYLMYRKSGVESFIILPLRLQLAKISIIAMPWRERLSDLEIIPSMNQLIEQISHFNGTIYLIAKDFPLKLSLTVRVGDRVLHTIELELLEAFSEASVFIQTAQLVVRVVDGGSPLQDASVTASNRANGVVIKTTDKNGRAKFFLPEGNYIIQASKNDRSAVASTALTIGSQVEIELDLADRFNQILILSLITIAIIGILANIWIWLLRPLRAKTTLRPFSLFS